MSISGVNNGSVPIVQPSDRSSEASNAERGRGYTEIIGSAGTASSEGSQQAYPPPAQVNVASVERGALMQQILYAMFEAGVAQRESDREASKLETQKQVASLNASADKTEASANLSHDAAAAQRTTQLYSASVALASASFQAGMQAKGAVAAKQVASEKLAVSQDLNGTNAPAPAPTKGLASSESRASNIEMQEMPRRDVAQVDSDAGRTAQPQGAAAGAEAGKSVQKIEDRPDLQVRLAKNELLAQVASNWSATAKILGQVSQATGQFNEGMSTTTETKNQQAGIAQAEADRLRADATEAEGRRSEARDNAQYSKEVLQQIMDVVKGIQDAKSSMGIIKNIS